jgi:integrase
LFACWRAACRMPYPYAPMLKMLILTGQRHSDVACAPWREFKIGQREWIIAAGRFKSKAEQLVPLTEQMIEILKELPRFKGSDFLFSATLGKKASDIGHRIKKQVDERMVRTLKALARKRGEDPSRVKLEPFVVHDLRRTMRTRLTKLKIPTEVAEAVIGHGKKGLDRIYNLHEFEDEKRDALERWAAHLRSIVEPTPANVVKLRA